MRKELALVVLGAVVGGATSAVMREVWAEEKEKVKEYRAQRFVLVDEDGVERGKLATSKDGLTGLMLHSREKGEAKGKGLGEGGFGEGGFGGADPGTGAKGQLYGMVHADGSGADFTVQTEEWTVTLGGMKEAKPALRLKDKKGKERTVTLE